MNIIPKLYKFSEKIKSKLLSAWISYFAGVTIELLSDSSSVAKFLGDIFDLSKLSILILWVSAVIVALVWMFNVIQENAKVAKKVEVQFKKIMKAHTCDIINQSELNAYSWGYNKTLCVPKNPGGWRPEDIFIDLFNSEIDKEYTFNKSNTGLGCYNDAAYEEYCKTNNKIHIIRQRGDDHDRYGITHIERSMKGNKVELRLQKTKWSQLQFSWDYLRRLDVYNQPNIHPTENEQINNIFLKALNHDQKLLINSFCLHLILVSKNNKVILAKISKVKSNDYPSTWAATLGEQIERSDFINDSTGELYSDFVTRWVKRALSEEIGIEESSKTENDISELEEYVDMDSLRVLSIDFESDIYNVALTCVVRLNIDAEQLKTIKEIKIDGNENTNEFRECTEKEIRKILLEYPNNQNEYHPSTYLRLLMFHLYSFKQSATMSAIVKENKKP